MTTVVKIIIILLLFEVAGFMAGFSALSYSPDGFDLMRLIHQMQSKSDSRQSSEINKMLANRDTCAKTDAHN